MKAFKIIVLAKQVPDTRNVGKDAMKANGTVNRAALPAIFNPEDLKALEQALRVAPIRARRNPPKGPLRRCGIRRRRTLRKEQNPKESNSKSEKEPNIHSA